MRIQSLGLGLALLATPSLALAQIESEGTPAAVLHDLRTESVPVEFVQPPDVGALLAEDEARTEAGPLRYGAVLPVELNMQDDGVWDALDDGTLVWRFKVLSPGAHSIGLEFTDFWLPEGGEVYLYDDTLETIHGAYTAVNNQPHDELQFAPFAGESVIFEYVHPPTAERLARLELGLVIYDYKDVFALEADLVASQTGSGDGGCDVNANCPIADPYALQKRSVVRTLSGGGLCTAFLVNNTANDQTRYVLSAWHCGQSSNTVFRFNYQTANCSGGAAPTGQQVSGATQLVSSQGADGRLMRINNNIPASYNPYYAGWTRSTANPSLAYGFHHPGGGPKQFAIDNNGATKATVNIIGIGVIQAWRVVFNNGTTEGGSSGSPLFNQNNRSVGQLSGGPAGSCQAEGYYARFDRFWAFVNLAQYLDPLGTGVLGIDGLDPNDPGGGGGNPNITGVTPSSIEAVNPTSPISVTLTGTGFLDTTAIEVDGVPLVAFPPQFSIVDDTTINVTLLPPYSIGTKEIKVIEGAAEDTIDLPVTFNLEPTIDLVNSDPGFLISALPVEVYMGGLPGETHFLLISGTLLPSVIPGIIDAGIGNNLTDLFSLGTFVVNAATGWALASGPISGVPLGTKLYFQSGTLDPFLPALPLTMTNIESGTVLF